MSWCRSISPPCPAAAGPAPAAAIPTGAARAAHPAGRPTPPRTPDPDTPAACHPAAPPPPHPWSDCPRPDPSAAPPLRPARPAPPPPRRASSHTRRGWTLTLPSAATPETARGYASHPARFPRATRYRWAGTARPLPASRHCNRRVLQARASRALQPSPDPFPRPPGRPAWTGCPAPSRPAARSRSPPARRSAHRASRPPPPACPPPDWAGADDRPKCQRPRPPRWRPTRSESCGGRWCADVPWITPPAARRRRSAPPRECADRCRSGTGSRPSRPRSPRPTDRHFRPAAPPPA